MTSRAPSPNSARRIELETAIARGVPNHRLMAEFGLTYRMLRNVIASMVAEPAPYRRPPHRPTVHGTESAWKTHKRKSETPCVRCAEAHALSLVLLAESRRRANTDKRLRGVA